MDEFRRVCHKSFLKQNAGFLLDRDEYAYASDREKKIYWNLVNVSQSDSSTISTESLAGLKMHNIWSATLFFC